MNSEDADSLPLPQDYSGDLVLMDTKDSFCG